MVRETGIEPVWSNHTPLKRARLPVPPLALTNIADYITQKIGCQGVFSFFCDYIFYSFPVTQNPAMLPKLANQPIKIQVVNEKFTIFL